LCADAGQYFDNETGVLEVPLSICIANQVNLSVLVNSSSIIHLTFIRQFIIFIYLFKFVNRLSAL